MEQVAIGYGSADVAMLLGMLEGHGFDPIAIDRHAALMLSDFSMAVGGVKIMVPSAQAEQAVDLLRNLGLPQWRAPSWTAIVLFAFAWWIAAVPPPGLGSILSARVRPGDEAVTTFS